MAPMPTKENHLATVCHRLERRSQSGEGRTQTPQLLVVHSRATLMTSMDQYHNMTARRPNRSAMLEVSRVPRIALTYKGEMFIPLMSAWP